MKGMKTHLLRRAWRFLRRDIGRLQLNARTDTHKHIQNNNQTLSWVGLNTEAAPAPVIYLDTKAIPHIN